MAQPRRPAGVERFAVYLTDATSRAATEAAVSAQRLIASPAQ